MREILSGLLVIVGAAEVFPITIERKGKDFFPSCDQLEDQIRKVQILTVWNEFEDARFENIYTHADNVVVNRFFNISIDPATLVQLNNTQIDLHLAAVYSYRGCCSLGFMK